MLAHAATADTAERHPSKTPKTSSFPIRGLHGKLDRIFPRAVSANASPSRTRAPILSSSAYAASTAAGGGGLIHLARI